MIFFLTPPRTRIDLPNFNECCFSRFKFFLEAADKRDYETTIEKLIPGTEMDKIGHFLLRCFCIFHPVVKDFVVTQETNLFFHRLQSLSWKDKRRACRSILKQISQLQNYKVFNKIECCYETPNFSKLLCSALNITCEILLNRSVERHLERDCKAHCDQYYVEVPFQMCLTLMKTRSVKLQRGYASIPCSMWTSLLVELFHHHYEFGLSMITNTILPHLSSDVRWKIAFSQLSNTYETFKQHKSVTSRMNLTARQVDNEQQYFPPCMSHLLKVLRTHHRLTHTWRYNFSLFLKDIGLNVNESIEFWKIEYSKSCTAGTSCTHSWQANQRKYIYSIRHLYGLEGSRLKRKTKSCRALQEMPLGMREEGGCPFVHFDDTNLLTSLSCEVVRSTEVVEEILRLKAANNPLAACSIYRAAIMKIHQLPESSEKLHSPVNYYTCFKQCSDSSLDW